VAVDGWSDDTKSVVVDSDVSFTEYNCLRDKVNVRELLGICTGKLLVCQEAKWGLFVIVIYLYRDVASDPNRKSFATLNRKTHFY